MPTRHPRERPGTIAAALDRIPMPVLTISETGIVDWVNPVGLETFGDIVGRRYTVIFAPESVATVQTAFARKQVGETRWTEYEAVVLAADGSRLQVEISSVSLEEDGHFVGVFGVMHPERTLPPPKPLLHDLTPRQAEVLSYLARGYSTSQMAAEMGVSVATVRNHVRDL